MGGVQSGTHNLGEALWVHERQRQRCHRESTRYEAHSGQTTQDRRKLLKRTRSLAVISEDESRQDREARQFRLGQSSFDLSRRHQLIPRAKLIDRNSLKDSKDCLCFRLSKSQQHLSESYEKFNEAKSYHSRSTCGLHSIPPALETLPDPLPYTRGNRVDPDRLNILDWPEPPRRYRSVQALDTVSGLVDIVEDNWPIEGNRSIDCIYTQVKRKRKEHRSLDSILFEDDGELEYFDVLNLLPLSNVRLELDEEDARNNNSVGKDEKDSTSSEYEARIHEYRTHEERTSEETSPTRSNATDEEKCKGHAVREERSPSASRQIPEIKIWKDYDSSRSPSEDSFRQDTEKDSNEEGSFHENERSLGSSTIYEVPNRRSSTPGIHQDRRGANVTSRSSEIPCDEGTRKFEEAEDYKSIWISDTEDHEDMSRRPQILKVVDNDITKRRHRRSSAETEGAIENVKPKQEIEKDSTDRSECLKEKAKERTENEGQECSKESKMTEAKNFFERKSAQKEAAKQSEGRFERIVKETSNILGKACSAVKGTLGFEARSESSDLGLGSESGSESRRRSMDDAIEDDPSDRSNEKSNSGTESKKVHTNLTRSRSCTDSIENDGQEFDHVRYKIVKSNMFSKNMFNTGRGDVTYNGLMQYLREYSFQELLLDNNVVIIEPVRAEPVERKSSPLNGKVRLEPTCKIAGAIQKKTDPERSEKSNEKIEGATKSPKQSSIKKHFFYHPIRVNRELIDEELPDPDTVRNVRRMFENTMKTKNTANSDFSRDCKGRKSVSMKDLSSIDGDRFEETPDKPCEGSRSRCSSRAKDLTRLFESMDKSTPPNGSVAVNKDELESPRSESKTRILAQSFEARSGHTSPSDSHSSKNKVNRYHHQHHHNWDAGSVSSGVSSDYPDTDPGSGVPCTSSEDEDIDCHDDDGVDGPGHYVSQDVLKKIRECGTSVTYYGGKVVNTCNGPLISPLIGNRYKRTDRSNDYVKFRLVKSNSCDSRLELTGRLIEDQSRCRNRERGGVPDLRQCTIAETPSIEITTIEKQEAEDREKKKIEKVSQAEVKREPPVVIGLEPKREESKEGNRIFKADFKLGNFEDSKSSYPSRFSGSALTRWQVNECNWKPGNDFGKMEFEEFEVLEDGLNNTDSQSQKAESS